jgi:hypothetical protein
MIIFLQSVLSTGYIITGDTEQVKARAIFPFLDSHLMLENFDPLSAGAPHPGPILNHSLISVRNRHGFWFTAEQDDSGALVLMSAARTGTPRLNHEVFRVHCPSRPPHEALRHGDRIQLGLVANPALPDYKWVVVSPTTDFPVVFADAPNLGSALFVLVEEKTDVAGLSMPEPVEVPYTGRGTVTGTGSISGEPEAAMPGGTGFHVLIDDRTLNPGEGLISPSMTTNFVPGGMAAGPLAFTLRGHMGALDPCVGRVVKVGIRASVSRKLIERMVTLTAGPNPFVRLAREREEMAGCLLGGILPFSITYFARLELVPSESAVAPRQLSVRLNAESPMIRMLTPGSGTVTAESPLVFSYRLASRPNVSRQDVCYAIRAVFSVNGVEHRPALPVFFGPLGPRY